MAEVFLADHRRVVIDARLVAISWSHLFYKSTALFIIISSQICCDPAAFVGRR